MKVMRRTFEALAKPKGSAARDTLNLDPLTSEYMAGDRYMLREDDGTRLPVNTVGHADTYRSKNKAEGALALAWRDQLTQPPPNEIEVAAIDLGVVSSVAGAVLLGRDWTRCPRCRQSMSGAYCRRLYCRRCVAVRGPLVLS